MTLETDLLLDRRRLKRRLFLWRTLAVVALVGSLLLAVTNGEGPLLAREHVARVTIKGLITEDREMTEAIAKVARDDSARALLVIVDSSGGTVAGGESLHGAIARVAGRKPVVAVLGGTAASAGYMVAVPAERIFAREATLTGSIGVKLGLAEVSGLLDWLGINSETIASGPLKDEPSLTKPLSEQGRAVLQALVADMHDQFVEMVATGRKMPEPQVRELADGRAYTGRQALKLGLVDAIGGETEARQWLAEAKQIGTGLAVRDVGQRGLSGWAASESLLTFLVGTIKTVLSQHLSIDGAWAIWHPSRRGE